jgi:hypothetical protein
VITTWQNEYQDDACGMYLNNRRSSRDCRRVHGMLYKINPSCLRRLVTQMQINKILLTLSYLCMTTLTEVFPYFFLSCKAHVRVNPRKDGARPARFLIFVCSMYFCVVLCIVCVYMPTELLPPGGYPIAVKYIISYISLRLCHRISCACAYSIVPRPWSSPTCSQINAPLSGIYIFSEWRAGYA